MDRKGQPATGSMDRPPVCLQSRMHEGAKAMQRSRVTPSLWSPKLPVVQLDALFN